LFQCRIIEEAKFGEKPASRENRTSKWRNQNPLGYSTTSRGHVKKCQKCPLVILAVALCTGGGEATAIAVERAVR
jgi:hypothetical protein